MAVPEAILPPQRGLDHFVLAVRDLDAAQQRFQDLGFTTTPRARHPWGTENVLVQLQGCFIELLGISPGLEIAPPKPGHFSFGHFNQDYLQQLEGVSMLVFSSQDAAADRQRWLEQGLTGYAPFDFSRMATLDDGQQVPVAFSLAFVSHIEMPRAAWFVCQQHYPENFWKPAFQQHANGASDVEAVVLATREPGRYGAFLSALFAQGQLHQDAAALELELPRGRVRVKTASELESWVPGIENRVHHHGPVFALLEVKVRHLGTVVDLLQDRHIAFVEVADGIVISPSDLFGVGLLFR